MYSAMEADLSFAVNEAPSNRYTGLNDVDPPQLPEVAMALSATAAPSPSSIEVIEFSRDLLLPNSSTCLSGIRTQHLQLSPIAH
jgi:hypothetical protein